ncbi:tripartite tricarboxylate transporter substrate-binding protein [Pigmentiphaga sp.]|uniref:Bug family tripartite tricarboxylate transporter substrate binding protein n=1 Tax=Pigmentiphaga sp. TaxID=1977564 RepID=UPI00128BA3DB|nr:tripartite tricarboxylate transporter substrate-binding protein [Pigmentiphaga sp.]MPS29358.1 tripartite tricarboxylate transporter substrate binding protein [Alcaligenaceae bacterium SAGV5]MPS55084.1 tripartite tricarboxylate transporter substrate binding protein [Alcaligenaceae bacterium SAGV3]MPT56655.1 tripartite tricarboxylate transporter substrate binding protein [Alcaligenaceae bacterium]
MRTILLAVLGTAMLSTSPALRAQEPAYPARPIRLIVAFGPGSVNDAMARELAKTLYAELGQPVIVENKPGAGGVVGTDYVAKAAPDGYTLGFGTSSQLVMNVGLQKSLPFDVERDLAPIGLVSRTPLALAVPTGGAGSLADLVKQAKGRSQSMTYSSSGVGSINHIAGAAFARAAGIDLMHVPYKGAAVAAADLAAGRVDMMLVTLPSMAGLVEQGKVKVLANGIDRRGASTPNVPTFAQAGLPAFKGYTWNNVFAPAGTPAAIIARLNAALNRVLADPQVVQFAQRQTAEIMAPSTPAQALAFEQGERATWVPFIRSLGIEP